MATTIKQTAANNKFLATLKAYYVENRIAKLAHKRYSRAIELVNSTGVQSAIEYVIRNEMPFRRADLERTLKPFMNTAPIVEPAVETQPASDITPADYAAVEAMGETVVETQPTNEPTFKVGDIVIVNDGGDRFYAKISRISAPADYDDYKSETIYRVWQTENTKEFVEGESGWYASYLLSDMELAPAAAMGETVVIEKPTFKAGDIVRVELSQEKKVYAKVEYKFDDDDSSSLYRVWVTENTERFVDVESGWYGTFYADEMELVTERPTAYAVSDEGNISYGTRIKTAGNRSLVGPYSFDNDRVFATLEAAIAYVETRARDTEQLSTTQEQATMTNQTFKRGDTVYFKSITGGLWSYGTFKFRRNGVAHIEIDNDSYGFNSIDIHESSMHTAAEYNALIAAPIVELITPADYAAAAAMGETVAQCVICGDTGGTTNPRYCEACFEDICNGEYNHEDSDEMTQLIEELASAQITIVHLRRRIATLYAQLAKD